MAQIERFYTGVSITAASSAASTTPRIAFNSYSGGGVLIASTNGATQIQWHGAATQEGVPLQIYADGAAVTTAVTVGAHPIPEACFGMHFVAPVIVGAASCALTVMVKG